MDQSNDPLSCAKIEALHMKKGIQSLSPSAFFRQESIFPQGHSPLRSFSP